MAAAAVLDLQDLLNETATDPSTDPAARVANLRSLRADISAVLGQCERYIGDQENARESDAMGRVSEHMRARENADVRGDLLDAGVTTPEQLDAAGMLSHDELDRRVADGSIEEAFGGLWDPMKHPRARGGEFGPTLHRLYGRELATDPIQMAASDHATDADRRAGLARIQAMRITDLPEPSADMKRMLGGARNTQEAFSGLMSPGTAKAGRMYAPERKPVHDKIVGSALAPAVKELLGPGDPLVLKLAAGGTLSGDEQTTVRNMAAARRHGNKPIALFTAGGPASGKSTALKAAPQLAPEAAVHVDPDKFKEQLPEFQHAVKIGDRAGANLVHDESTDIARRVRDEARGMGLNMVVDGTGDGAPGKFVGKLHEAHDAGYDTRLLYTTVPTDTAVIRSVKRARGTGRFVPVDEVRGHHAVASRNFPEVAKLPFVSDLKVYDTTAPSPILLAHGSAGQLDVQEPDLFQQFLDKAEEGE